MQAKRHVTTYQTSPFNLAETEEDLQRVVNEFYSVCKRRKLKVNARKNKVMVFERREEEAINFNTAYSVRLPAVVKCRIILGSEKLEEVSEFKVVCSNSHGKIITKLFFGNWAYCFVDVMLC